MSSSVIRSVSYDEKAQHLGVVFVNGLRYNYTDVPPEIAEALRSAPSQGAYFNAHIRDRFAYVRDRSG